jgi:exopolyphosphatase/guanosine-5'-triphosphate,3'-diphosphate pyrophosphatase
LAVLENTHDYLASYTYEERISKLGLKPDRADVIVIAAEIYTRIMKSALVDEIKVPKVGLSDGIILELYKNWENKIS